MSTELDLVTGGTGFIGQHLVRRLLASGRRVRVLTRRGSEGKLAADLREGAELAFGDLRDSASLEQAAQGAARIFHCAGHVLDWGSETQFRATNVEGTRSLLEAARAASVRRFVHLSSIAAFGTPAPPYFDDDSPYGDSDDLYSRTKAEGEALVFGFGSAQGLPVTVLRPAVVYGPGGTWLEEPLQMVREGKMFLLGGGRGTCHPCYIENLIDAMELVAEDPRAVGRGYIVADDSPVSFREYFSAVASLAGKGPVSRSIPLPMAKLIASGCEVVAKVRRSDQRPLLTHAALGMVTTKSRMSMKRIREELGFRPRFTFREAIEALRPLYAGGPSAPPEK
jgi:nucleoside-diphosphate-sugar epimerase